MYGTSIVRTLIFFSGARLTILVRRVCQQEYGSSIKIKDAAVTCQGGFAKSRPAAQRPAAQRPAAHGPRPSGPRPTARHGPAARRPEGPAARGPRTARGPRRPGGPEAHTVLLSSGKSTHMHRFSSGLGAQMKDGEFEFVYHFNNHFNLFFRCMLPSEKRCHSLLFSSVYNNKQKQGFK